MESTETLPLTVGGVTAQATIVDNDGGPTIKTIEPGLLPGALDDQTVEGLPLNFGVTLSNASDSPTTFAFALGGGTASAADYGTVSFTNGVILNADGTITVPAGVTAFNVSVQTTDDKIGRAHV